MTSRDVTKAVAKKLKYYVDIRRREDGFDLTGPYLPAQDPVPLRRGPTLAYDGLHDRSLKHYFRDPEVKTQVGKMLVRESTNEREAEIRRSLDEEMAKRSYKNNAGSSSPFVTPNERTTPKHRPQALISVDEYLKTKKGSKQRKNKPDVVGKPRNITRRSPPRHVLKNERERLVNMAARLIAATEMAALPGNRTSHIKQDSSTYDSSLPDVNSKSSYTEESSETEFSVDVFPRPPSRAGRPHSKWTPPRTSPVVDSKPNSRLLKNYPMALSDTSEDTRNQTENAKASSKKNKISSNSPTTTAGSIARGKKVEPRLHQGRYRPDSYRSGNKNSKQKGNKLNLVTNGKSEKRKTAPTRVPKSSKLFTDSSEGEGSEILNTSRLADHKEQAESRLFHKRYQPMQTAKILTYQAYVVTGNRPRASTDADVRLTLFGENGTSGERCLLRSTNHSRKFRRGQVDIFPVDSVYIGDIRSIRIGHTQTSRESGWFLEKVFISEGEKGNRVFEFPCKRWFSSEKDDGQILRDVCVSQVITESELAEELYDYSSAGEESSDDESHASFASVESDDVAKTGKENGNHSSDEERTIGKKTRKKSSGRTQNSNRKGNRESSRKKTVSFEGDSDKDASDSDYEKRKFENDKSDYSESEYSGKEEARHTEDSNSDGEVTEGENAEVLESGSEDADDEKPGVRKVDNPLRIQEAKNNHSDDKSWEGKISEGGNSKGENLEDKKSWDKNSDNQKPGDGQTKGEKSVKTPEKDAAENSREDDDFWSTNSKKGEPIHYDLGIHNDNETNTKQDGNSRSRSHSSASSSLSEEEDVEKDERERLDDHVSDGEQSGGGEEQDTTKESGAEHGEEKSGTQQAEQNDGGAASDQDSNKDYMAGFLAGVRAAEHTKETHDEDEQTSDESGLNETADDGDFIVMKGPSFHAAVASGNVERVKELIQHNPLLKEQTDEKGWIPLHVGCANGQLECVKLIAVSGGNLQQETPTGYTSMHLAAMNGHVNCMMVLFALGAEISCRTVDEHTPLHLAAMSGHIECVKWLLANRAKHDVTDVNGRTPVDIAEEYCYDEVAELLKSFKKEMTARDSTLSHLMTYEGTRRKSVDSTTSDSLGAAGKVADSGVGGVESGEESWISDQEDEDYEEDEMEERKPSSVSSRPTSARRPSSAKSDDSVTPKNRTDSMTTVEEKQKLYERQREQMKKRHSSFLDSIRMDVENDFNTDF